MFRPLSAAVAISLTGCATAALSTSAAAGGGRSDSPKPPQALSTAADPSLGPGEKLLRSASGSFSVVVPDRGWQIVQRLAHAVKLEPGDRPLSLAAVDDYLLPEDEAVPVGKLLEATLGRELAERVEWRVVESGDALLGQAAAHRLQATALIGQAPVMLEVIGRRQGHRLCYLQLTATPAILALGLPAFERAADTFRCTPAADEGARRGATAAELAAEAQRAIEGFDPSRGVALLSLAVQQDPKDPALVEKLVQAELLTGDGPRALRTLKTELARFPDRFEHWQILASIQLQGGDATGGLATLHAAASRPGAPAKVWAALGEAYVKGGNLPEAERDFREAVVRDPRDAEAHAALGDVLLRENQADAAEAELKRAIALEPGRGEFLAALSDVYGHRNQDALAAGACLDALERGVPKPLEATLKYNLACFSARLGRQRDCLFWLRQAFEAGFNDVEFMRKDPDLQSVRDLPAFQELFGQ